MLSISPTWSKLTFEGEGSLWIPISNMNFDHPDPCNNTIIQMNRIAIRLRLWLRRAIKRINERTDKLRELGPDRPVVTCQIHTGISGHPPQISPARFGIRQSISPVDELKSRRPRKSQYRLTTLQIAYLELRVAMSVT